MSGGSLPLEQDLRAVDEGRLELLDLRTWPERRLLGRPPSARPVSLLRHLLRPAGPDAIFVRGAAVRSQWTLREGAEEVAGGYRAWRQQGQLTEPERDAGGVCALQAGAGGGTGDVLRTQSPRVECGRSHPETTETHAMRNRIGTTALLTIPMAFTLLLSAAPASAETPPRPGCGYGDTNHAHQAAPGLDPMNLRPGAGSGDQNHPHTAPPGQAPDGGGDQSGPMRGCKDDPRG